MSLRQIVIFDPNFVPFKWEHEVRDFIRELRKYNDEEEIEHMLQGETVADVENNIPDLYTCMNCDKAITESCAVVFQNAKTTLYHGVLCGKCLTKNSQDTIRFMRANNSEMLPQYFWGKEEVPWETFIKSLWSFLREGNSNSSGQNGGAL